MQAIMIKLLKRSLILALLITAIALAACTSAGTGEQTPRPSPVPTETLPTSTPSLTATVTLTLITNPPENCELPCWWGIIPGETSWEETQSLLEQFAVVSIQKQKTTHNLYSETMHVNFASAIGKDYGVAFGVYDGTVRVMIFYTQLHQILTRNGVPEKIWVDAYANAHGGITYYAIVLYYPSQGNFVYLENETLNVPQNRSLVEICPYHNVFGVHSGSDWLYSTSETEVFWEGFSDIYDLNNFAPLEAVSDWDAQKFYDSFKDPASDDCFIIEGHE